MRNQPGAPPPPRHVPADAARSPRRRVSPLFQAGGQAKNPSWPLPRRKIQPLAIFAVAAILVIVTGLGWMFASRDEPNFIGPRTVRTELPASDAAIPAPDPLLSPETATGTETPEELEAPDPQSALSEMVLPEIGDPVLSALPVAIPSDEAPARRKASPVLIFDSGADRGTSAKSRTEDDDTKVVIVANPIPAKPAPAKPPAKQRGAALSRGTLVPAVLETVIDGSKPGAVRAVVTADVRSHDGRHLLVPRSSRLVGQYRIENGRAYVIWTRLERPGSGAVRLASVPGGSNSRFMQGFSAASLQSVVSGSGPAGVRARPGEPVRIYAAGTVELGKDK